MVSLIPKSILSQFFDLSAGKYTNVHYYQFNDGISNGTKIVIDGQMNPAAAKFELSLIAGTVITKDVIKYGDIGLYFSVSPSGGYALVNARIGRVWGREERTARGRLPRPLLQNQKFRLTILIDEWCFQIDVNERQFISFQHKMPFTSIGIMSYDGDAVIDNVETHKPSAMSVMPSLVPLPVNASAPEIPSDHVLYQLSYPKLPLLHPIKCGLQVGMTINISARPKDNRFDISLYQGPDPYSDLNSDVAFHMEIHMKENQIIRNSNQTNQWQSQEKFIDRFPFHMNFDFNMIIKIEANRYVITVNGRHLFDFYHRVIPLSTIDYLGIHGGVQISSIYIMNSPL